MLESIFGNKTIEKVLFYLEVYEEAYGAEISKVFNIPIKGVQQQFERLENGGIIVSQKKGRTRIYKFNPRNVFIDELRALLNKGIEMLPRDEIKKYYRSRTRPRRKQKPL
jgi:sugar-specific transcriptional regulator TrmB